MHPPVFMDPPVTLEGDFIAKKAGAGDARTGLIILPRYCQKLTFRRA